jgi:6-phosphogluconolactonase
VVKNKNIIQLSNAIKIFSTPYELAVKFAEELVNSIIESADNRRPFTIALSGGSTPELLFSFLGDHFSNSSLWDFVHFFWVDERCVLPDSQDSNFGMTKRNLLDKIEIPSANIHRIRGEGDPEKEASRYSEEISDFTLIRDGLPLFNMIILGLGEDGHTASIFPGHLELFNSGKICEVAVHPLTTQKRITLTGKVLNNADTIAFLVTGSKKADIVEKLINIKSSAIQYPASYIVPVYGLLNWYFDEEAAKLL